MDHITCGNVYKDFTRTQVTFPPRWHIAEHVTFVLIKWLYDDSGVRCIRSLIVVLLVQSNTDCAPTCVLPAAYVLRWHD